MSDFKIFFNDSKSQFVPSKKIDKSDLFDTSYSSVSSAIGELRYPMVNNGRYNRRHPILTPSGDEVGYLVNAASQIGYTWCCVYAGNCFWLTNQTFQATVGGGGGSISVIAERGNFLFSSKRKFKLVKSFDYRNNSWKSPEVFKLLDNGLRLFVLSKSGFCLFDTYDRKKIAESLFNSYITGYDFAFSPKVEILAIATSFDGRKDPIDGEYRYKNAIWIYNLETGNLVGEKSIDINKHIDWKIEFDQSGRKIKVSSRQFTSQFELTSS